MNEKDVLDYMTSQYNNLTRSSRKVADYIFANKIETQFMSITALAEECGVADATIFRFCKALGYEGYNTFKLALARSSGSSVNGSEYSLYAKVLPTDSINDMCKKLYTVNVGAINQTLELIDETEILKAVELLSTDGNIYCFGQGGSLILAMEAWAKFITVAPNFHCIQDSHLQAMTAATLRKNDVILFISYSGATKDMIQILELARSRGTKVIIVTHFKKSPGANMADVVLLCGSKEGPLQSGSVAAKMGILFLIDVVFNAFCRRNPELINQNMDATANSIANKLL